MRPSLFVCGVKLQRLRAGRGDVGRCRAGASVYSHESPSARHFSSASSCSCRAAAIYQRFACSASRAVPIPADSVVVPFRMKLGDDVLSFMSTTMTFGTPLDVTLAEIAIETFFPADPATAQQLRALAETL